jgi:hypothetical protein
MAKYTTEEFIEKKCKPKHGDKYDYSSSEYKGLDEPFTFICPTHGEVTQKAKSHLVRSGCIKCDEEKAKTKRRGGKYAKNKGRAYEYKIRNELKELGYPELVTSAGESKKMDNMKVDLIDPSGRLPFYAQIKCTKPTPSYHAIAEACPLKDKPLVIFWNKQNVKEGQVNMSSEGEVVILPKEYFYQLIKAAQ